MRTFPGRSRFARRRSRAAIDEVRHSDAAHQGVDLKRRPPKSRPDRHRAGDKLRPLATVRRTRRPRFSFFRFTCQTAEGPVKVPLLPLFTPRRERKGRRAEPPKSTHPTEPEAVHRIISEGLRRRAVAPSGNAPRGLIYSSTAANVNRQTPKNGAATRRFPGSAGDTPGPRKVRFRSADAALRPHSSAVLYTIVSGMSQCGGAAASALKV